MAQGRRTASVQKEGVVKGGLNSTQLLVLAGGLIFLGAVGTLTWLGWGFLEEEQGKAQTLVERIGNPKLASLLGGSEGVQGARREAKQISSVFEEVAKGKNMLVGPWIRATILADGAGQEWAKDPGKWKDRLIETRKKIGLAANAGNVVLATNFYLGMEAYQQKSPAPEDVPALARQLSVSERLVQNLIEARRVKEGYPTPCRLEVLRFAETPQEELKAATSGSPPKPGVPGPGSSNPRFSIQIESSPEVLIEYVRLLSVDDWPFMIRNLQLENEKSQFMKRSEIAKKFQTEGGSGSAGTTTAKEQAGPGQLLLEVLAGNELVRSRIEVEFHPWAELSSGPSPAGVK